MDSVQISAEAAKYLGQLPPVVHESVMGICKEIALAGDGLITEEMVRSTLRKVSPIEVPIYDEFIRRERVPVSFCENGLLLTSDTERSIQPSHPMLAAVRNWPSDLRDKIAAACFKHYQRRLEFECRKLPITAASDIWTFVELDGISISNDVPNIAVIYVKTDWDDLHMDLAIADSGEILYADTFVGYSVASYANPDWL